MVQRHPPAILICMTLLNLQSIFSDEYFIQLYTDPRGVSDIFLRTLFHWSSAISPHLAAQRGHSGPPSDAEILKSLKRELNFFMRSTGEVSPSQNTHFSGNQKIVWINKLSFKYRDFSQVVKIVARRGRIYLVLSKPLVEFFLRVLRKPFRFSMSWCRFAPCWQRWMLCQTELSWF